MHARAIAIRSSDASTLRNVKPETFLIGIKKLETRYKYMKKTLDTSLLLFFFFILIIPQSFMILCKSNQI